MEFLKSKEDKCEIDGSISCQNEKTEEPDRLPEGTENYIQNITLLNCTTVAVDKTFKENFIIRESAARGEAAAVLGVPGLQQSTG